MVFWSRRTDDIIYAFKIDAGLQAAAMFLVIYCSRKKSQTAILSVPIVIRYEMYMRESGEELEEILGEYRQKY